VSYSTCDLCGAEGDGSAHCPRCGQRMPTASVVATAVASAPVQPERPSRVADPSSPVSPPVTIQKPNDGGARKRLMGFAAVAVAIICLVAFLVLRDANGSSPTDYSDPLGTAADAQEDGSSSEDDTSSDSSGSVDESLPDEDTSDDGSTSASSEDPLGLGYTFEDQPCSDSYIIVLASSGDPSLYESTLLPALSRQSDAGQDAKYLRTDESCSTFNQSGEAGDPIYAAYVGPYDDPAEACQTRMDTATTATYVKSLDGVGKGPYYCACAYDVSELPDLNTTTDAESAGERRFWVVELQHILFNEGMNPEKLVGGNFGSKTVSMVSTYQRDRGLSVTGSLDSDTWAQMQSDTCL